MLGVTLGGMQAWPQLAQHELKRDSALACGADVQEYVAAKLLLLALVRRARSKWH